MSESSSTDSTCMDEYAEFVRETCRNRGPSLMKADDGKIWGAALELVSESAEVLDVLTKASRKRGGWINAEDKGMLLDELSDVLWGVQALANALGVTLEEVAEYNTLKLKARLEEARTLGDFI